MHIDDGRMKALMEESNDLHNDAMRRTTTALDEVVDRHRERSTADQSDRRGFLRRSLFAAGALGAGTGAAVLGRAVVTVFADSSADVTMLQTSASIENLAVAVYAKALTLPASVNGAGNPVIAKFVTTTKQQHSDHAQAFNAAITKLGGKPQTGIDQPVYDGVVTPALGKIKGPADVVGLALTLEDAAAQTYVKFAGDGSDSNAISAWATIAPVEAQHAAVLRAVQALLAANMPELIALPPNAAALPGAAGSVGFPAVFYPTQGARPAGEGAVKS